MSPRAVLVDTLPSALLDLRKAASSDLRWLAALHDRELDADAIRMLWETCYEDFFALQLLSNESRVALARLREGLTELPTNLSKSTLDQLAADYADIYLNYGVRASPCESVWLDEDHLAMQEPMFQVRAWYRRHGVEVEDWRKRSDDHLVPQLVFLAYLLHDLDEAPVELREVADFLDQHLLRWIHRFAERVAVRCATHLYAGLALLTAAYLNELRDLLAEIIGDPRASLEELEQSRVPDVTASLAVNQRPNELGREGVP